MIPAVAGRDAATRIRRFSCFVLLALGVALAFHAVMRSRGMQWPWTSFLFAPSDRYNDWHNSVAQAASGDPYFSRDTPALAAYFPWAYVVFAAAAGLSRITSTLVFLFVGEVLLVAAVFSTLACNRAGDLKSTGRGRLELPLLLVLTLQCSYPVMFAMDRGNIDLWIACSCTLFVALQGSRLHLFGLAMLALSIAAKGYPAAFLALLVVRRDYTGLAFCVLVTLLASLLGLLSFHGGIAHNIAGLRLNLDLFYQRYVLGADSLFASSDPYNAIRLQLSGLVSAAPDGALPLDLVSANVLKVYTPVICLFALCCAWFVLAVPAAAWRRVTAVCLIAILFPNVATDYKLCCLMPGMLLLLLSGNFARREYQALALFALLMIPKSYYFFNGHPISMYLNPVLLIALAWQVMGDRDGWRQGWRQWRTLLPGNRAARSLY